MIKRYTIEEYCNLLETTDVSQCKESYFDYDFESDKLKCCALGILGKEDIECSIQSGFFDSDDVFYLDDGFIPSEYLKVDRDDLIDEIIIMNDEENLSFKEIADKLRKQYGIEKGRNENSV